MLPSLPHAPDVNELVRLRVSSSLIFLISRMCLTPHEECNSKIIHNPLAHFLQSYFDTSKLSPRSFPQVSAARPIKSSLLQGSGFHHPPATPTHVPPDFGPFLNSCQKWQSRGRKPQILKDSLCYSGKTPQASVRSLRQNDPPSVPELLVESVSRLATVLDRESPPRLESTD